MITSRNTYGAIVLAAFYAIAASAETLSVTVSNVKVGKGKVRVGLFNQENEFPDGKIFKGEVAVSEKGVVTVVFKDLKPGIYAVSVFQDINGNKVIDKNFLGIPKEPYGFSGAWKSGGSSFDKSAFELKQGGAEISIKMK
jgi:uncharacterized protein (DUF2141 family)